MLLDMRVPPQHGHGHGHGRRGMWYALRHVVVPHTHDTAHRVDSAMEASRTGMRARTDALASLAVLVSAGGAALGWRWADPVVGLAITAAILVVTWGAAKQVLARLMDAVDPALVERAIEALRRVDGVVGVDRV